MSSYVKVDDIWKEIKDKFVKVNDIWKDIDESYIKIDGIWKNVYSSVLNVEGGIVTYEYDNDILYQIHTFNTSDELIVHNNGLCDILLVGGGGGGGEGDNSDGGGGGGGGGGLIYMENYLVYNGVYEVIVGDSVSSYTTGLNTIFNGLIALGGGRGGLGYTSGANRDGGCGGDGGRNYTLGGIGLQPTSESGGFGYNGGNGGGPNKRSGGVVVEQMA